MTTDMPAPDTAGAVLGERYSLGVEIGKGGMGVVWRGRDNLLKRDVAIKEVRLPPEVTGGDRATLQGRVLREARAAGRLSHPAAVTVYDVVQEQGRTYIVMELLDAPTLADVVERNGPLPPHRVAALGLEILGALERAHAEGIVHRDLKPQNVMLTDEGRAKLADFGIATLKGDLEITSTGILLGSPAYMAPEQAQGDDSGPPADLWALGATLYYALEGEPPFERGQPIPTLAAVVYDDPRPPQRAGPLAPILRDLLQKSPADRLSGERLRAGLAAVAGRRGASVPAAGGPAPKSTAPIPRAEQVWDRRGEPLAVARPRPRSRTAFWSVVAAAFVGALIVGVLLFGPDGFNRSGERRDGDTGGRAEGQRAPGAEPARASVLFTIPEEGTASVPEEWVAYEDPTSGFEISHPPDWEVVPQSRDEDSIDIEAPDSGAYLRVDWTDEPSGSPVAAWQELAPVFAANHDDYEEIQITPATFKGYPAAIWEFTYTDGGADLHAADVGFATEDYGFALFFQTHAEEWAATQDLFESFQASFQAPS
jgi:hypothetical protein